MKSFSEELKELALTAPKEEDAENIFDKESNAKLVDYNDIYEEVDKKKEAEPLIQGRYKGRNISREEIFNEDYFLKLNPNLYNIVGGDNVDDDDDDDDYNEQDLDAAECAKALQEKQLDEHDPSESSFEKNSEVEESDDYLDNEDGNDEESEDEANDPADTECDISTSMKPNERFGQIEESIENKERSSIILEEIHRGQCIANQMKIMDKFLEHRIQFQRVLALANRLPPCNVFKQTMKDFLSSVENSRMYKQCVRNVERAFIQLAEIRAELISKYPEMKNSLAGKSAAKSGQEQIPSDDEEIPSDIASACSEDDEGQPNRKKMKLSQEDSRDSFEPNGNKNLRVRKRGKFSLNERAEADEEFHRKFIPFRNVTIDKWYQRTKLASGKTSNAYSALEQAPVKQIENILQDKERLIQRTQVKRSQYKIIGLNETDQNDCEAGKQLFPEIFDDDDFYHHLLRAVIERKTQELTDPLEISKRWIEIQKLRTKVKRKIDTKASKGRKIRYDVISKLSSFMTPHDASTFSDQAKDELFSSLFGKHTAPKSDSDIKVSKESLDGFKLFK